MRVKAEENEKDGWQANSKEHSSSGHVRGGRTALFAKLTVLPRVLVFFQRSATSEPAILRRIIRVAIPSLFNCFSFYFFFIFTFFE